jgi:hypothetical protein
MTGSALRSAWPRAEEADIPFLVGALAGTGDLRKPL